MGPADKCIDVCPELWASSHDGRSGGVAHPEGGQDLRPGRPSLGRASEKPYTQLFEIGGDTCHQ
ncbi:MAG: hypothetical protein AAGC55_24315, partial [Myxococcota bacterium]